MTDRPFGECVSSGDIEWPETLQRTGSHVGAVSAHRLQLMMSTDTVLHAARRMVAGCETALVIIEDAGRPEGLVTGDDLVARCVARNRAPDSTTLREVMSRAVHTVRQDTDVEVGSRAWCFYRPRRE